METEVLPISVYEREPWHQGQDGPPDWEDLDWLRDQSAPALHKFVKFLRGSR